ncbi:MAG: efflux transporter outer membrane subunit [Burkholderiaceae bacterium]
MKSFDQTIANATHRLAPAARIVLATLTLAGCTAAGPDYRMPSDAAANRLDAAAPFAAAQEAALSAAPLPPHWWRLYRDRKLDALIDKALHANTDLRVAAANLARVRGALAEVEAAGRPAASVTTAPAYGRASAAAKGFPSPLPASGTYDAGAAVSYQVDLFGKLARATEAAEGDVQAAQAALDLARVTVAADTARAYVDACSAARQLAVARRSVGLQQEFVRFTTERTRGGRGTPLDVSRARSQLEQLRAAVPPLQAQQRTAGYRLAVLTGEVPGSPSAPSVACRKAPRLTTPIPVGDGTALLRRRPDIRQAERTLAAATARIGVATADLYPSVSLGLSAGSSGTLAGFGATNAFRWSLGPLITWTLPSNGAARSRIAQAQAGADVALARFDATVLAALRETETALTVYARDLDRDAALVSARDQSALAARQADELYRYGRTDFLTVLDARRTLASAESALAASDGQLAADQVALFLALGGGWEQEPDAGKAAAGRR